MALEGKIEREIEVKADADEFYNVFRKEMHLLPTVCSQHLHSVELHHGDWETVGSVKHWNYNLDGTPLNLKEKVEEVDEENRSITFRVVEGDILKHHYSNLKVTIQATPNQNDAAASIVKWTMEYQKCNDDVPPPDIYMDLAAKVIADTADHLLRQKNQ